MKRSLIFTYILICSVATFAQNIQLKESWWQPNGFVHAIAEDTINNTVYIGGDFSAIGPNIPYLSLINKFTGQRNVTFPKSNGSIFSSVSDGNGGWFIGGQFSKVGDSIRNNIAHITNQGIVSNWDPNIPGTAGVETMFLQDSILYIGGNFTTIGTKSRNNIAAINANSGVVTNWNPNANAEVRTIVVADNIIYVGGLFTSIGGSFRSHLAAINKNNGFANSWNPSVNDIVDAIMISGNKIYVGGTFTSVGWSNTRNNLCAFNKSTGNLTSWNPNTNGRVYALEAYGTKIYVGGSFNSIGGQTRAKIAALDTIMGLPDSWNPNILLTGAVYTLKISSYSLFVGGNFSHIGGSSGVITRNNIASFNISTGNLTSWDPSTNNPVYCIASDASNILLGGSFTSVGAQVRRNLAALDATTGVLKPINVNVSGDVYSLKISDSMLYVGGNFSALAQTRNNLIAYHLNSGYVSHWDPNVNSSGTVYSIDVSDSTVYIGGSFFSVGGQNRRNIAAISTITALPRTWNPGANTIVRSLKVSGPILYVAGGFNIIGGQNRNGIAALDRFSGNPTSWNPNANQQVYSIDKSGSTIYAGGSFTAIGGQARIKLAAIDSISGNVTSWNPILSRTSDVIRSIIVADSNIIFGGFFTNVNGQPRNHLAMVNKNSGQLNNWNPNSGSYINSISNSKSNIYVGGLFTNMGGNSRSYFAAFSPSLITGVFTPTIAKVLKTGFHLYPNPSTTSITIELAGEMNKTLVEIFNSKGQLIKKCNLLSNKEIIDLSSLPKGIYYIRNNGITQKLVIAR